MSDDDTACCERDYPGKWECQDCTKVICLNCRAIYNGLYLCIICAEKREFDDRLVSGKSMEGFAIC